MVLGSYPDRCGYSQRLPMLVISPWTRQNYVSHKLTNTVSIIKFVESNWLHGKQIGGGSYDSISGSLAGVRRPARLLHQAALQARHPQPHHGRGGQQLASRVAG